MTDLKVFGNIYTNVKGIKATDTSDAVVTFGDGYSLEDIASNLEPSGDITIDGTNLGTRALANKPITSVTITTSSNLDAGAAFMNCANLRSISIPNSERVSGNSMFENCTSLVKVDFPYTYFSGQNMFQSCTALKVLRIGNNTSSGTSNYFFRYDSALRVLAVPRIYGAAGFPSYSFQGLNSLEVIDTGGNMSTPNAPSSIPLHTLILRKTTVASLSANGLNVSDAFKNGGTGGDVYIPESLYNHLGDGTSSDYKSATNWSVYDGYGTITWHKIEGSIYESISWDTSSYES